MQHSIRCPSVRGPLKLAGAQESHIGSPPLIQRYPSIWVAVVGPDNQAVFGAIDIGHHQVLPLLAPHFCPLRQEAGNVQGFFVRRYHGQRGTWVCSRCMDSGRGRYRVRITRYSLWLIDKETVQFLTCCTECIGLCADVLDCQRVWLPGRGACVCGGLGSGRSLWTLGGLFSLLFNRVCFGRGFLPAPCLVLPAVQPISGWQPREPWPVPV